MSKQKEQLEQMKMDILQDHLTTQFRTEVGTKALVEREVIQNELTDEFKMILKELGTAIGECGAFPVLKHMQYVGSFATHVFIAPLTKTFAFMNQIGVGDCSELVAAEAVKDLKGSLMTHYSQRRQKRRSGI